MQKQEQEVARANEEFYLAFESLDPNEMEKVWAKETYVQCGHPGWRILRGWDPVIESWRQIFQNTSAIRFLLTDVSVQVRGDLAWVTVYENLNGAMEGGTVAATVLTTNIFEKRPEGWRMIHHHGSSVVQEEPPIDPSIVH